MRQTETAAAAAAAAAALFEGVSRISHASSRRYCYIVTSQRTVLFVTSALNGDIFRRLHKRAAQQQPRILSPFARGSGHAISCGHTGVQMIYENHLHKTGSGATAIQRTVAYNDLTMCLYCNIGLGLKCKERADK